VPTRLKLFKRDLAASTAGGPARDVVATADRSSASPAILARSSAHARHAILDGDALYQRCEAALRSGQFARALSLIKDASARPGTTAAQYRGYARMLLKCGDFDTARNMVHQAIAKEPGSAEAWDILGSISVAGGALEEACACYAKAIDLDPKFFSAGNNMAVTLARMGRLREAEKHYRNLLADAPGHLHIRANFAALLGDLGEYQEAWTVVQDILRCEPAMVKAHTLASTLLVTLGRYTDALMFIERAISLAPQDFDLPVRRADILRQLGRGEEALAACDEVLEKLPCHPEMLHERAMVLRSLDRPEQALEMCREAQSASPKSARIAADRGWLLAELGRKEEAIQAFDEALAAKHDLGAAWYGRSLLVHAGQAGSDIQAMEKILGGGNLPYRERILFSFALGKSYLAIDDADKAFPHFAVGNRLKRATFNYDWRLDLAHLGKMSAVFSPGTLLEPMRPCEASEKPILVLGMPRSGTTLVEQMLASHSLVDTIGEAAIIGHLVEKSHCYSNLGFASRSETVAHGELRRSYLDRARRTACGKPYFVDKTPGNFLHLGLASLILPEARIIHCRRDPLDTCLSCYTTLFTDGHEYSYDLGELGRYYGFYRELMAYWHSILPPGNLLELDYELLVDDTEGQARRIFEFCGLTWEPGCLRFHETKRHVKTASFNQVRSPVYRTSIRRAEKFRPWLGTLEAALANTLTPL
jgi:tetratricopeptide (TPR) repeat protein